MASVTVTLTVSPYDRVPESDQRSVYATLLYGPVHDSINDYDILGRKRRVGYVDQTTGVATFTLERNSDTDDPDSVWRVQVGGANYLRRWTSATPSTVDLGDDTWEVGQTPPNGVDYQLRSERGQPNGYAPLDSGGLVPTANLPSGGGGGGGAPTGSAGGDLAGTYPSPTVPGLVTNATAITAEATARTAADAAHVAATDPHGDRAYTDTQVTAEATTRASADTTLTTAVAGKAAATDLTAEVSRAEAAEATKAAATDLTAEVTRATGVEAAKADLVSGLVPTAQIPPIALTQPFPVADQTAMLALTAQPGDFAIRADNTKSYVLAASPASTLSNWLELTSTGQVASVNTQTGAVVLGAADVGAASASALTSEVTRATAAEGGKASTTDTRFSDARTPTAHASSHASGGSDPTTLAESQITGLGTDLAKRTVWRGAWATSTAYAVNDLVTHGGGTYLAPTAFTSGGSFVPANWTALTSGGITYPPWASGSYYEPRYTTSNGGGKPATTVCYAVWIECPGGGSISAGLTDLTTAGSSDSTVRFGVAPAVASGAAAGLPDLTAVTISAAAVATNVTGWVSGSFATAVPVAAPGAFLILRYAGTTAPVVPFMTDGFTGARVGAVSTANLQTGGIRSQIVQNVSSGDAVVNASNAWAVQSSGYTVLAAALAA